MCSPTPPTRPTDADRTPARSSHRSLAADGGRQVGDDRASGNRPAEPSLGRRGPPFVSATDADVRPSTGDIGGPDDGTGPAPSSRAPSSRAPSSRDLCRSARSASRARSLKRPAAGPTATQSPRARSSAARRYAGLAERARGGAGCLVGLKRTCDDARSGARLAKLRRRGEVVEAGWREHLERREDSWLGGPERTSLGDTALARRHRAEVTSLTAEAASFFSRSLVGCEKGQSSPEDVAGCVVVGVGLVPAADASERRLRDAVLRGCVIDAYWFPWRASPWVEGGAMTTQPRKRDEQRARERPVVAERHRRRERARRAPRAPTCRRDRDGGRSDLPGGTPARLRGGVGPPVGPPGRHRRSSIPG